MVNKQSLLAILIIAIGACEVEPDPDRETLDVELLGLGGECPLDSQDFLQCMEDDDERISFRKKYTLSQVIDACEGAYDNGQQIDACITNVCGYYGCDGW